MTICPNKNVPWVLTPTYVNGAVDYLLQFIDNFFYSLCHSEWTNRVSSNTVKGSLIRVSVCRLSRPLMIPTNPFRRVFRAVAQRVLQNHNMVEARHGAVAFSSKPC